MKRFLPSIVLLSIFLFISTNIVNSKTLKELYFTEPDIENCSPGILSPGEKVVILYAMNQIRVAHGLKEVTYDDSADLKTAQGALLGVVNGQLSHNPPDNWGCYNPDAADANANSNLHLSATSDINNLPETLSSLIGWMIDDKNLGGDNLGHRRAILNPFVSKISFGRVDGYMPGTTTVAYTSMNLNYGLQNLNADLSATDLEYVAYPYGGYLKELVNKDYFLSFHAFYDKKNWFNNKNVDYKNTVIEVTNTSTHAKMTVTDQQYDNDSWGGIQNQLQWKVVGLEDDVTYEVEIKNVDVNGTIKDYKYDFTIGEVTTTPNTIVLSSPEDGAVDVEYPVTLIWTPDQKSQKYFIEIATDIDMTNIVDTSTSDVEVNYISNNLIRNTTYYWRVKGINDTGEGEWSDVWSFTTNNRMPMVELISPVADGVIDSQLNFAWQEDSSIPYFEFQLSASNDFSTIYYETDFTSSNNSLEIEFDLPTAFWRVRAFDGDNIGEWSEARSFDSPLKDEELLVISPLNGEKLNPEKELSWSSSLGSEFILTLADNITLDTPFLFETLSDTKYNISSLELEDGKYFWNVISKLDKIIYKDTAVNEFIINSKSVIENGEEISLKTYPNPLQNEFYVDFINKYDRITKINIYSFDGILIDSIITNNKLNSNQKVLFNTKNLSNGTFILQIENGNKIISSKLIK